MNSVCRQSSHILLDGEDTHPPWKDNQGSPGRSQLLWVKQRSLDTLELGALGAPRGHPEEPAEETQWARTQRPVVTSRIKLATPLSHGLLGTCVSDNIYCFSLLDLVSNVGSHCESFQKAVLSSTWNLKVWLTDWLDFSDCGMLECCRPRV